MSRKTVTALVLTAALAVSAGACGSDHPGAAAPPPSTTASTVARSADQHATRSVSKIAHRKARPRGAAPAATLVVSPISPAGAPTATAPGAATTGRLPPSTDGGQTWTPVVSRVRNWYEVRLLGPPNGGTAWVRVSSVHVASDPYYVQVVLSRRRLSVYRSGKKVGTWPVAVGAPATPTPTGVTYVAGDLAAVGVDAVLAPLVRPLAFHTTSKLALEEFPAEEPGGQAGVIAIHGWEDLASDRAIFGQAISHGCIRVPAAGMAVMALVPDGTLVAVAAS